MLTKPKAWSAQKCLQMAELLFLKKRIKGRLRIYKPWWLIHTHKQINKLARCLPRMAKLSVQLTEALLSDRLCFETFSLSPPSHQDRTP